MVEHSLHTRGVSSSNLLAGTKFFKYCLGTMAAVSAASDVAPQRFSFVGASGFVSAGGGDQRERGGE